jgi:hypothetical protein
MAAVTRHATSTPPCAVVARPTLIAAAALTAAAGAATLLIARISTLGGPSTPDPREGRLPGHPS